jgi:ComF family protein
MPQEQDGLCATCQKERPPYRALRPWLVFDGPIRNALHQMKYRSDIGLGDALAAQMTGFVHTLDWPIDLVTPVPLSKSRRRERGYNQVALVARPLSMALGLTYAPAALVRCKNTHSQVGLSREERRENVRGVFRADARVRGKTILLVDDVATTGSTLTSGAEALLAAGASQVYALTIARALARYGLHQA